MTCVISKGPVHLAESFLEDIWSLRFLALSQTLSPTFQDLKWEKVCSFMHWWVSLWVASASFHVSSIWLSHCSRARRKILPRGGWNCSLYPIIKKKGNLPVAEWAAALQVNLAIGWVPTISRVGLHRRCEGMFWVLGCSCYVNCDSNNWHFCANLFSGVLLVQDGDLAHRGNVQKPSSPATPSGMGLQLPTAKALAESCEWQASRCWHLSTLEGW